MQILGQDSAQINNLTFSLSISEGDFALLALKLDLSGCEL